jgi:aminoglycoside 3-N-acetyltransferase
MSMKKYDYNRENIRNALLNIGIKQGDSIFIHSNLGFFGKLENAETEKEYCQSFKDIFLEILGSEGTLIVPTFSYSFCNNRNFDINTTKGVCGMFSEYIRLLSQSVRSEDPNFSISAIGKKSKLFTQDIPIHSFGKNSFWEKLLKEKGKICNLNFDVGSTFIHYVEKSQNVSYRFDKIFRGNIIKNGIKEKKESYHFVYDLKKAKDAPDFTRFHKKALEKNIVKKNDLGKGQVNCISVKNVFNLIMKELQKRPRFLVKEEKNDSN